jgi:SAM-dependent methyltransferase
MRCPICQGQAEPAFQSRIWRISPAGRGFGYLACRACRFLFCDPLPTAGELDSYYAAEFDYGWYDRRRLLKRLQGDHRWRLVRPAIERLAAAHGRLLDVGCGEGWFIAAARRAGWRVAGVELAAAPAARARRMGLDVVRGAIEALPPPEQRYDVIALWHSLEHMHEPRQALAWVRAALAPGGVALIAVPNIESRGAAARGAGWTWVQQPFVHLWHFSARSLGLLLEQAGFETLACATRDTWDAQYLYDGIVAQRLEWRYFKKLAFEITALLKRLRVGRAEQIGDWLFFALCEVSRLAFYALYLVVASLRGRRADGSELLVIARPRPVVGAKRLGESQTMTIENAVQE